MTRYLYTAAKDVNSAVEKINHDLTSLSNWLKANKLIPNIQKTK